jgi:hypothetical protein
MAGDCRRYAVTNVQTVLTTTTVQADEACCGTAGILLHMQITHAATAELERSDPAAPLLEVY